MKKTLFMLLTTGIFSSFIETAGVATACEDAFRQCLDSIYSATTRPQWSGCYQCGAVCAAVAGICVFHEDRTIAQTALIVQTACTAPCQRVEKAQPATPKSK